ncbi:hypothetical protein [Vallitalea okinawensis]|uniref:hypothetical protein n=1 Tax=Vallitalea okinawensis TaxID=2078660 RepID=UPI000CFCB060|nr:hypothetical protein [Vallitalea okinawensis]
MLYKSQLVFLIGIVIFVGCCSNKNLTQLEEINAENVLNEQKKVEINEITTDDVEEKEDFSSINDKDQFIKFLSRKWLSVDNDGWIMEITDKEIILKFYDMEDHIIYSYNIEETNIDCSSLIINITEEDRTKMHNEISGFGEKKEVNYFVKIIIDGDNMTYINKYNEIEDAISSRWTLYDAQN